MRLEGKTWRVLWEAHAWAGALTSVVLVGMFLLGAFALFEHELMAWQEPRLRAAATVDEARVVAAVQSELDRLHPSETPAHLDIDLPAPYAPWIRVTSRGAVEHTYWIDPATGERAPERSDLGEFLFLLHFLYPFPSGMLIAGVLALLLLMVVLSGLLLQLGRFFREWVRYRPAQALRTAWSELHKVLGSVGLPFQAMMAWTAAIICLNATVLRPIVVHTAFDGDVDGALASTGYLRRPAPTGEPGPPIDVAAVLAQAGAALPGAQHYRLTVRNLGDTSAIVDVRGNAAEGLLDFTNVRTKVDGALLHVRPAGGPSASSRLVEGAYLLHSGTYGGMGLRIVYLLLALFSVTCIVTGNLIWLERHARSRRTVDVLLARLTAGGCGGAAFGLAAIFLANQLLPDVLPDRAAWEHGAFYVGWCAAVLGAFAYPHPARAARALFVVSGATFVLLPLIDAWKHGRVPLEVTGSPYLFWADVAWLIVGAAFLGTAAVIRRFTPSAVPVRRALERRGNVDTLHMAP